MCLFKIFKKNFSSYILLRQKLNFEKNQSKKYQNIFVKLYTKNELIKFENLLLSISKKFTFVFKITCSTIKHEF